MKHSLEEKLTLLHIRKSTSLIKSKHKLFDSQDMRRQPPYPELSSEQLAR